MIATALLAILAPAARAAPPAPTCHEESRVSMACTYVVKACGTDVSALRAVAGDALDEVDRVDRLMSHYRPESPLSRLNREAASGPVRVEPELYDFVAKCLRYGRVSEGAFDVTVGPLMKAWGLFEGDGRVPGDRERAEALAAVGYRHVVLDPAAGTIRFDRPGVALDLGGIAKGYAVDRVVELLRRRKVTAALVNAGGSSIYALGAPPGEAAWDVRIQDPVRRGRVALTVPLNDRALSVSGASGRGFQQDGVFYGHIMDPRRGFPVQGPLAVAVLSDTATEGDALADAFYVQGAEWTRRYVRDHAATAALFFQPGPERTWTLVRVGR
jgi:thiamine biosynthesis lipoprotein